MKQIKTLAICASLVALSSVALARRLTVNVGYGKNGSQGTYICYLYRDGYLYDVKTLRNTGFVSGTVDFDVPTRSWYWGFIYCQNTNQYVFTNTDYFQLYNVYMTLNGQFPK